MNSDKSSAAGAKTATDPMNDLRLGAARRRLEESRGQEDAIEGLREIVANFLGSEEMGLFHFDRGSGTFQVYWSFGIDLQEYDLVRALGQAGLQRVMSGECHVELGDRERSGAVDRAQAFVPISLADKTIAVLAILRLLPQKVAFDKSDMELFKLLSDEAAKPLFGSAGRAMQGTDGAGLQA
jgi:hypothetical protein